jgi:hypothetical protein
MHPDHSAPDQVSLRLDLLADSLALIRMAPDAAVPAWTTAARHFLTITRTPAELSIVADAAVVPNGVAAERGYRAFRVEGPIPLHLVGVAAALVTPLAAAKIPVFLIATYDTDYLLVRGGDLTRAREALTDAGHRIA